MAIRRLPARVILCGIGYHIQEHEGLIAFVREEFTLGEPTPSFSFQHRDLCWYLELNAPYVMMSHVQKAFTMVVKAYGDNHYPISEEDYVVIRQQVVNDQSMNTTTSKR